MATDPCKAGGHVHVTQVANNLLSRGHKLYTNLTDESDKFIRLTDKEFFDRGKEIDVFYIRIHGSQWNDGLTELRKANFEAPCIWEINAPMEEVKTRGVSDKELKNFIKRRVKLAKMVDAAICVSKEMEEYAKQALGIKNTLVLPNGSDIQMFGPHNIKNQAIYNDDKFNVLWSGSTEYKWQAYEVVQQIARKLYEIDKDITFIITAEGESKDNIIYTGRVPYNEMPGLMAACDVGLCLYNEILFYDKFFFSPLKLFDYMASELPVIGNNLGQIKDVIEENKNGILTNGKQDDIIEKILYLKEHNDEAINMGKRGRDAAITKYNWKRVVEETEKFMINVIDKKKSASNSHSRHILSLLNYTKWLLTGRS